MEKDHFSEANNLIEETLKIRIIPKIIEGNWSVKMAPKTFMYDIYKKGCSTPFYLKPTSNGLLVEVTNMLIKAEVECFTTDPFLAKERTCLWLYSGQ